MYLLCENPHNLSMKPLTILKSLDLLQLTSHEAEVFLLLQKEPLSTPLTLSRKCAIPRASIYVALETLRKRGLAHHRRVNKKSLWSIASKNELADTLYETKKAILGFVDGKEEVRGVTDGFVTIHRGDEAVKKELIAMYTERDKRVSGYLGALNYSENWAELFKDTEIRKVNDAIKKRGMIIDAVLPDKYTEDRFKKFGVEWAKSYEGRTASTVYAPKKYFQNAGELYFFKNTMYLLALRDKMIIEIKHSDIQKMILDIFGFMKDHGERVDINRELRELIEKSKDSSKF